MRIAVVALVVLALTATASAAASADARRLALRQNDVPSSATRMSEKENRVAPLPGGTGQAYTTTFQFRVGRRTEAVGTIVITAPSVAVARRVFAEAVGEAKRTAAATLRLPVLGDEQYAALYGRPALDETSAAVWTRKGVVVWQIQTSSVRNPFGFSKAEALAELTKYARRQQRRVGG